MKVPLENWNVHARAGVWFALFHGLGWFTYFCFLFMVYLEPSLSDDWFKTTAVTMSLMGVAAIAIEARL